MFDIAPSRAHTTTDENFNYFVLGQVTDPAVDLTNLVVNGLTEIASQ